MHEVHSIVIHSHHAPLHNKLCTINTPRYYTLVCVHACMCMNLVASVSMVPFWCYGRLWFLLCIAIATVDMPGAYGWNRPAVMGSIPSFDIYIATRSWTHPVQWSRLPWLYIIIRDTYGQTDWDACNKVACNIQSSGPFYCTEIRSSGSLKLAIVNKILVVCAIFLAGVRLSGVAMPHVITLENHLHVCGRHLEHHAHYTMLSSKVSYLTSCCYVGAPCTDWHARKLTHAGIMRRVVA